jgi:hypothetical protein
MPIAATNMAAVRRMGSSTVAAGKRMHRNAGVKEKLRRRASVAAARP